MAKCMAVNAGSSSIKYKLYEMPEEKVICSGLVERIGHEDAHFNIKFDGQRHDDYLPIENHAVGVKLILDALKKFHIVEDFDEIKAVGHRVVQGGKYFAKSAYFNEDTEAKIKSLIPLDPLHAPAHLVGFHAFHDALPNAVTIAVFDTAYHQTMQEEDYLFPIPYEMTEKYDCRRYGAHGTSHYYVSRRCAELMGMDINHMNLITCHLGNGASITAIRDGKCINTSMGLTPLGGIMMGTRSGDIDPTVVFYMMKKLNLTPDQMDTILNKRSGMLGVSGISSDARDIQAAVEQGNERAILTTELYTNRVINVVGGYYMELGHTDAMVFTAGLGENDSHTRERILKHLEEGMGLSIDYEKNAQVHGTEALISKPDSKVAVWVIPTNEELVIARDTVRLLGL